MRLLICPNPFKGTMTNLQAAQAIARAAVSLGMTARTLPLADGGDGSIDCLLAAGTGWKSMFVQGIKDPLGRPITGKYLRRGQVAFVQQCDASGMKLLKASQLNPLRASTYGTGQTILKAIKQGAREVRLGIGGSATVDMGIGLFRALGGKLLNQQGKQLTEITSTASCEKLLIDQARQECQNARFVLYCDVQNKLVGPLGGVRVFGPQKGVSPLEIALFENRYEVMAKVIKDQLGIDVLNVQKLGAGGGAGTFLHAVFGAEIRSGFGLQRLIEESDLIVTGEGKIDRQSLMGKTVGAVAKMARGKPVIAICGIAQDQQLVQKTLGIKVVAIDSKPRQSHQQALQQSAERVLRAYLAH